MNGIEFHFHRGSQAGTRIRLAQPVIRIGRHPENDLRFHGEHDRDASARHAEIRLEEGRYLLSDLGSTNGTLLNGTRIAEPRALQDGDVIEFGANGPSVDITLLDARPKKNTEVRIAV